MNLSARLSLVFGTLGLVTISLVASVSWVLAANEVRASTDEQLLRRADAAVLGGVRRQAAEPRIEANGAVVDGNFESLFSLASDDSGLQLFTADGVPIGEHHFDVPAGIFDSTIEGDLPLATVSTEGGTYRFVTVAIGEAGPPSDGAAYVQFYREISSEEQALSDLAIRLLVTAVLGLLAVGAASWLVGRWLARPLGRLADAAGRLAKLDDLPSRIDIDRSDEIGDLGHSFNRVLAALQVGREQQRRLVADAGHELRTPLTALRGRTEFLATAENLTDVQRRTHQQASVDDVERLSSLVAELLDLATDPRATGEELVEVSLNDLVVEVATRTEVATGRRFVVQTDATTEAVRPTIVRQALQNLVDNAAKFSSEPEPITITLDRGRFEVIDYGIGIPADDVDLIFGRFFRSDAARSQPGTGLGLAIVARAAETHGGKVWARSDAVTGTRVGFSVTPD